MNESKVEATALVTLRVPVSVDAAPTATIGWLLARLREQGQDWARSTPGSPSLKGEPEIIDMRVVSK